MELSADQKKVLRSLFEWLATPRRRQYVTVGGYAGTGKTTMLGILRKQVYKQNKDLKVSFCAYTGKAARVLRTKLQEAGAIYSKDTIGTIHSLIYSPVENGQQEIVGWERKKLDDLKTDLIIVDEASMIDGNIWQDLLDFQKPIIAIGDHGQLPPINGSFNLMEQPELILTQIHRQAQDNPIIKLSIMARTTGEIPAMKYGKGVEKIARQGELSGERVGELLEKYDPQTLILTGYNSTRVKINQHIRQVREMFAAEPKPKDRVICLRNNHEKQVFNGMLGTVDQIELTEDDDWALAHIKMDDESGIYKGKIYLPQFNLEQAQNFTKDRKHSVQGDLFDFGYALTVHKAQGSQAKKVVLFEERFKRMSDADWAKWLYTAVTRAQEELYIIGD